MDWACFVLCTSQHGGTAAERELQFMSSVAAADGRMNGIARVHTGWRGGCVSDCLGCFAQLHQRDPAGPSGHFEPAAAKAGPVMLDQRFAVVVAGFFVDRTASGMSEQVSAIASAYKP